MNLTDATITIYNRYSVGLPPFPPRIQYDKTVIRGVHWEDDVYTSPNSDGKATVSQTALILIPLDADQSDKTFINPADYARLSNDVSNFWTANIDPANPDVVVLGEGRDITDLYTITNLKRDFKAIDIHGVSNMFESDILPHLEIRGI